MPSLVDCGGIATFGGRYFRHLPADTIFRCYFQGVSTFGGGGGGGVYFWKFTAANYIMYVFSLMTGSNGDSFQ